jgi:hypothetical protein
VSRATGGPCDATKTQTRAKVAPAGGGALCAPATETQACVYLPPIDMTPFPPTRAGMFAGKINADVTWAQVVGANTAFSISLWFKVDDVTEQQQIVNGWRTVSGVDAVPGN